MWFQNRRTKNRRTVDEGQSMQLEPGHTVSESSDDSCGDTELQDTSCTTTTSAASTGTTTRISSDATRLGRDFDNKRHTTATTSGDDEDEDVDNVFIGNHGNTAAEVSGWTELCRNHSLRHGLSTMSPRHSAVTIGQS